MTSSMSQDFFNLSFLASLVTWLIASSSQKVLGFSTSTVEKSQRMKIRFKKNQQCLPQAFCKIVTIGKC